MVSSQSGVSESLKPGCCGTITSNFAASDCMNGSQAPAPLAPCRNSSGGPEPPRISLMLQPRTAIVVVACSAISSPCLGAGSYHGDAASVIAGVGRP